MNNNNKLNPTPLFEVGFADPIPPSGTPIDFLEAPASARRLLLDHHPFLACHMALPHWHGSRVSN